MMLKSLFLSAAALVLAECSCGEAAMSKEAMMRAMKYKESVIRGQENHPIQHVVVLMLENRAFDHMLGWMKTENPNIQGLTGNEYNLDEPSQPNSRKFYVHPNASYVDPDPGHSVPDTTTEIFGSQNTNHEGTMNGFVKQTHQRGIPPEAVMSGFKPEDVPVITTLAKEFAMIDEFHAGLPGPTLPNRLMFHSATTHGDCTDDVWENVKGHPQKPIYMALQEAGVSWAQYFEEGPDVLILDQMRKLEYLGNYHWMSTFEKDAAEGNLANFSFIDPAFFPVPGIINASDQHPSHDVVEGEKLIKRVYDALRNGPLWNNTLFIVTYDEHGGFFDHKTPPSDNVPNPDGINCTDTTINNFHFNRLGVRIPFIMASPWINKGVLEHGPSGPKPTNSSAYDLTSVAASMHYHFNTSSFLTKRDAWAATFNHLLNERTTPRTDCPTHMPTPPDSSGAFKGNRGRYLHSGTAPLSDLQKKFIDLAAHLRLDSESDEEFEEAKNQAERLETEYQGALFMRDRVNRFLKKDPLKQPTHPLHKLAGK